MFQFLISEMKILLLGATGRTGKLVLETALKKDYEVNCLARNSQRIDQKPGVNVFEGNPVNSDDLLCAISGCDYVINTLNISRKSDFPWAKLRTPENYLSEVMSTLIPIAEKQNITRIVICSAWGVAETKSDIPWWFKWFIDNSNIGYAYRDHERQEALLMDSNLPWTIARPVGLTNSKRKQTIQESFNNQPKPKLTVSRQSVASYLVDSLQRAELEGSVVVVSRGVS